MSRPLVTPFEALHALQAHYKFGVDEFMRGLHVMPDKLRGWNTEKRVPQYYVDRVLDLHRLAVRLEEAGYTIEQVRTWFWHRNSPMREERPIDLLSDREQVQQALLRLIEAADTTRLP